MENVRPWVRFWARLLDMSFYAMIVAFIFPSISNFSMFLLLHVSYQWQEYLGQLAAWGFVNLAAYIIFEGILLSTLGTTLGKWICKISIRNMQGQKLSFRVALERTFLVYFRGLALLLPFISIITLIYAYAALSASGTTSWDKECHTTITHQRIGFVHIVAFIILLLLILNLRNSAMGIEMMTLKHKIMYVCGVRG